MKHFTLHTLILILIATLAISCSNSTKEKKQGPNAEPNAWHFAQRAYPNGSIKVESYRNSYTEAMRIHNEAAERHINWELAGPTNIGGRITDIEVDPSNKQTVYIGASTGGVWKSEDLGGSWNYMFADVPFVSVGDIAIDPNNTETLYVGTGEANSASMSFYGGGIYKSTNGGLNWDYAGLEDCPYFGKVIVDHENSNRVFAAAAGTLFTPSSERGIYRSNNGGTDWEQVLFVTDSTSAIDLVQDPSNPDILYAGMWERIRHLEGRESFGLSSGVWKTTDGGDNWERLQNGLPTGEAGRVGLAIAQNNPDIVYAYFDMPYESSNVYRTENGGESWTQTNDNELDGMCSNFGWYFGKIHVDPKDDEKIYVQGVDLYRSLNSGYSYSHIAGYFNSNEIHVDHHAMWIDDESGLILEGNDGGLYSSTNNGDSWNKINNLPLTQFYDIDIDYQNPERLYGGTQDNNSIRTLTEEIDNWDVILGGDGMYCVVDYTNSNIIFAEAQNGALYRSFDGGNNMNYCGDWSGDRVNWSAPYVMHPEDPSILYFGTYRIYKTENQGSSWDVISPDLTKGGDDSFHTITTIAISPENPNIIVCGSADGLVHISTDGGNNWENISAGLPDRWVTRVMCDPSFEDRIFVTTSGFRWDEDNGHVFMSENLGETWTDITGNLPELPVNVIIADPDETGVLFVGTDAGVFATKDMGTYWESINQGFPVCPVVAMKIHNPTRTIYVGTHGVSLWKGYLDELNIGVETQNFKVESTLTCAPNPIQNEATLSFELKQDGVVNLTVINLKGAQVMQQNLGHRSAGELEISMQFDNLSAGVYILKITSSSQQEQIKIVIQ